MSEPKDVKKQPPVVLIQGKASGNWVIETDGDPAGAMVVEDGGRFDGKLTVIPVKKP